MTCTDFVWLVNMIQWLWAGYGWIPVGNLLQLEQFIMGWFLHWGFLC